MKWVTGAIGVLAIALFASNPTRDEYIAWLKRQVVSEAADTGNTFGGVLVSLVGGPLLDASTVRQDYFLFSFYRTIFGEGNTRNIKVVGVFRYFVLLSSVAPKFPHVVAAGDGRWLPEDGYVWVVNPPVAGDLRVRWNAGQRSTKNPHVIAAPTEGYWKPEEGYAWITNPPNGDFRVKPVFGN